MVKKQRLGELLVQKGLVDAKEIDEALRVQVGGNRRLGYILIKMGTLSADQLLEALSDQLDIPIIEIEDEFSSDTATLLPRYLCRKYNVIPIALEGKNVVRLAMVDPLDDEAIADVEHYTGRVVKAVLARQQDISRSIGRKIPFSFKDVLNAQVFNWCAKTATVVAVVLLLSLAYVVHRDAQIEKYGTVTVDGDSKRFMNHDLIVGIEDGQYSIVGHGAYAKGLYSVVFDDLETMQGFIEQKKKSLSSKQYDWLLWVTENRLAASR